jgi:phosphate starvation-inducible PhoH-like protein
MKIKEILEAKDLSLKFFGPNNKNLVIFKDHFGFDVNYFEDEIVTNAPKSEKEKIERVLYTMVTLVKIGVSLTERDILYLINLENTNSLDEAIDFYRNRKKILITETGSIIYPKTKTQSDYHRALIQSDLIFGVGKAGTGKTYLAVAYAINELKNNRIKKIIITRPAVEAGEELGFLPGDLKEKIDPYLTPLYDSLYEMLGKIHTDSLIERGIIEIAPLAYMRGRTLESAIVILDEAQNTTSTQMKMFLTRLGYQSKMIVTGDPSQSDLKRNEKRGLDEALSLLNDLTEVSIITFTSLDVVRHPLVKKILDRYEENDKSI